MFRIPQNAVIGRARETLARRARRVLVVGDATVDIFPTLLEPRGEGGVHTALVVAGGTGLNVAIGLARVGHPVSFLGCFSGDAASRFVRNVARSEGVRLLRVPRSRLPTRNVLVSVGPGGERAFLVVPTRAADECLRIRAGFGSLIGNPIVIFVSGALLRMEPARSSVLGLLAFARRRGTATAIDLNIRMPEESHWPSYRNALRAAFRLSDIVLGTGEELQTVGAVQRTPRVIVVEKSGRSGCVCHYRGDVWRIPGYRVQAVDTTAAGDAFDAAFLHAFANGFALRDACERANVAGALACTLRGSSNALPTLAQIEKCLKKTTSLGPAKAHVAQHGIAKGRCVPV